jgi:cysteine synthase A
MFMNSALDAIGRTPLVALDRLARGLPARVLAKLEFYSPGGSLKDRVALRTIEDAERSGRLKPGATVVELTSGNMGIGLAVVCAVKGYRLIAVMSSGNSIERRQMIEAYGAKVELVPQVAGSRPGQVSKADLEAVEIRMHELIREHEAFWPDQFNNPSAVAVHEEITGPEIWDATEGKITHLIATVGTGCTAIGAARGLKKRNPAIKMLVLEPESAPFIAGRPVVSVSHKLQGSGYARMPPQWDRSVIDGFLTASDEEAISTARALAKQEGLLVGFSSGALVAGALRVAREAAPGSVVVTFCIDSGMRYLSTDLFAAQP